MATDLLVLGAGPAGWSAALQGAKAGLDVAVVEREQRLGGACLNTGTLPSKTLRHTIVQMVVMRRAAALGFQHSSNGPMTIHELMGHKNQVVAHHEQTIRTFLERNGVRVLAGSGSFVEPTRIRVANREGERIVAAENVVIATGSRPRRPDSIPFDDRRIVDSDGILAVDTVPRSLAVMGGGVVGCEYASMFAALGAKVTLIDQREDLLRFLDRDIREALAHTLRRMGVRLLIGETTADVALRRRGHADEVVVELESGRTVRAERLLVAAGRESNVASLDLARAGIEANERGLIKVDDCFRTTAPGVYAVGDVIGFPALASTSMHQGRMAVLHAAGAALPPERALPIALYTIPEISAVGRSEDQCREEGIGYEVGIARFGDTPRGQILGDHEGTLKLIFQREDRRVIGVHILGQGASELIHLGMFLVDRGGTLDDLLSSVFNYPTLSEAYRIAALDGANRL